jgi:hypothetical protein
MDGFVAGQQSPYKRDIAAEPLHASLFRMLITRPWHPGMAVPLCDPRVVSPAAGHRDREAATWRGVEKKGW